MQLMDAAARLQSLFANCCVTWPPYCLRLQRQCVVVVHGNGRQQTLASAVSACNTQAPCTVSSSLSSSTYGFVWTTGRYGNRCVTRCDVITSTYGTSKREEYVGDRWRHCPGERRQWTDQHISGRHQVAWVSADVSSPADLRRARFQRPRRRFTGATRLDTVQLATGETWLHGQRRRRCRNWEDRGSGTLRPRRWHGQQFPAGDSCHESFCCRLLRRLQRFITWTWWVGRDRSSRIGEAYMCYHYHYCLSASLSVCLSVNTTFATRRCPILMQLVSMVGTIMAICVRNAQFSIHPPLLSIKINNKNLAIAHRSRVSCAHMCALIRWGHL